MHRSLRMRRLLEALLLGPVARSRDAVTRVDDWPFLFQRARHHAVAGPLGRRLAALGVTPPSDVARAFARRDAEDELWFLHLAATLGDVARAFAARGVEYVALKGPALAVRVANPPHGRRSTDLDLLVAHESIDAATTSLAGLGYARLSGGALRDHAATHLAHPTLPGVELHHAAHVGFGEQVSARLLLDRARAVDVLGTSVQIPDPARELAYLAVHAAGHRFERLAWLVDIASLLDLSLAPLADVRRAAASLRGVRALELTLGELARARGEGSPRGLRARLVLAAEERNVRSDPKALLNGLSSALLADDAALAAAFVREKLRRDLAPRLRGTFSRRSGAPWYIHPTDDP